MRLNFRKVVSLLGFWSILLFINSNTIIAQENSVAPEKEVTTTSKEVKNNPKKKKKKVKKDFDAYDPLLPAKATFYSALVPGLGQAYQHQYWKIPIIYAAIGGSAFMAYHNYKEYRSSRSQYKEVLSLANAINPNDNADINIDLEILDNRQRYHREQQQSWVLATVGLYLLNVLEANVSAHLINFNTNKKLSLHPNINLPNIHSSSYSNNDSNSNEDQLYTIQDRYSNVVNTGVNNYYGLKLTYSF